MVQTAGCAAAGLIESPSLRAVDSRVLSCPAASLSIGVGSCRRPLAARAGTLFSTIVGAGGVGAGSRGTARPPGAFWGVAGGGVGRWCDGRDCLSCVHRGRVVRVEEVEKPRHSRARIDTIAAMARGRGPAIRRSKSLSASRNRGPSRGVTIVAGRKGSCRRPRSPSWPHSIDPAIAVAFVRPVGASASCGEWSGSIRVGPCARGPRTRPCEAMRGDGRPAIGTNGEAATDVLEVRAQIGQGLVSALGPPFNRPLHGKRKFGIEVRREIVERGRLAVQNLVEQLAGRVPREGRTERQQLIQDQADREDVAAVIDVAAFDLLRRHVLRRADQGADAGHAGIADACDAEVQDLQASLARDHQIVWLHVTMHESQAMRVSQTVAELAGERQQAMQRKRSTAGNETGQRLPDRRTPWR